MGREHGDWPRDAVAMVAAQLMEAEVEQRTGAARRERCPERVTDLNGYRQRAWETRVGSIDPQIPRVRSGPAYFPSFLEPRSRFEQAIVAMVMEADVSGVSTRKVDRLARQAPDGEHVLPHPAATSGASSTHHQSSGATRNRLPVVNRPSSASPGPSA